MVLETLRSMTKLQIPVIIKETGAGVSGEVALDLVKSGIGIIDVSGVGGTSWSGVEAYRSEEVGDTQSQQMGKLFWSWGIPTPVSIIECCQAGADVISSGGVRSGLDVAKSLAIGASLAGTALPLLKPATKDSQAVVKAMNAYLRALRISMFLTGSKDISELSRV